VFQITGQVQYASWSVLQITGQVQHASWSVLQMEIHITLINLFNDWHKMYEQILVLFEKVFWSNKLKSIVQFLIINYLITNEINVRLYA
jgi:hypothetical protein